MFHSPTPPPICLQSLFVRTKFKKMLWNPMQRMLSHVCFCMRGLDGRKETFHGWVIVVFPWCHLLLFQCHLVWEVFVRLECSQTNRGDIHCVRQSKWQSVHKQMLLWTTSLSNFQLYLILEITRLQWKAHMRSNRGKSDKIQILILSMCLSH